MTTDILSDQFKSRLKLTTKTVGEDRIRRAKENNEDVAVLSTFMPGDKAPFKCSSGLDCLLGDTGVSTPGLKFLLEKNVFFCYAGET